MMIKSTARIMALILLMLCIISLWSVAFAATNTSIYSVMTGHQTLYAQWEVSLKPPTTGEITQATEGIMFYCSWDKVDDVDGYCIWRKESSETEYRELKTRKASASDADVIRILSNSGEKVGVTYDYAISTYINTGDDPENVWLDDLLHSELLPIGTIKVFLPNPYWIQDDTKQTAEGTVKLSWNHVNLSIQDPDSLVKGYDIYMAEYGADEKDFSYIGSADAENGTTYIVDGLSAGKTYCFYLKSYRYVNGGKEPSEAHSEIFNIEIASMSAPTGFEIEAITDDSVCLSWNTIEGIDGYEILRSNTIDGEYSVVAGAEADDTSIIVNQYETGVRQYYKIRTYTYNVTVGYYEKIIYGEYSEIKGITVGKSENEDIILTSIRFDKRTAEITLGEELVLKLITEPETAALDSASYNCLDSSIAIIGGTTTDVNGCTTVSIIPLKSGITSVVCTSNFDPQIEAVCDIAVYGENIYTLPASLITVEEEAFANSKADMIIISDKTTVLKERAFADCQDLHVVYMPDSLTQIADNAFEGSPTVGFICESDNTAAAYAQEHYFPCLIREGH